MSLGNASSRTWLGRCLLALLLSAVVYLPADPSMAAPARGHQDGDRADADSREDAPGAAGKLSAALRDKASSGRSNLVDVIVVYKEHPGRFEDDRLEELGGRMGKRYRNFTSRALRVPENRLEQLSRNPNVAYVVRDAPIESSSNSARHTAALPAQAIDYSSQGWSLSVAVIDSGIGYHADLYPSPLQFDFLGYQDGDDPTSYLQDPWGHGTHVAGIIGGDGWDSQGAHTGVAPEVRIISLRVLDHQGRGVASDLLAALDWLIDNAAAYDIRVVNMSLGMGPEQEAALDPLVQAVEAVWDAGVVVVVSAGNYGRDGNFTITSPGTSRKVVTVGSLTDNGTVDLDDDYTSTYSSRGPTAFDHIVKPDLLAPGNRWISTMNEKSKLLHDLPGRVRNGTYFELSGTSMAAPMVAGAAALMIHQDPALTPATVKARLMRSARKVPGDPVEVGAGVLDIGAALAETGTVKRALSPKIARSEAGNAVLIEDTAQLWGPPPCGPRRSSGPSRSKRPTAICRATLSCGPRRSSGRRPSSGRRLSSGPRPSSGRRLSCGPNR